MTACGLKGIDGAYDDSEVRKMVEVEKSKVHYNIIENVRYEADLSIIIVTINI